MSPGRTRRPWLRAGGIYAAPTVLLLVLVLRCVAAPPPPVPAKLSDPNATPEVRELMSRLAADYGKTTWSGVYSEEDADYVKQKTGVTPAMFALDFILCSPSIVEHGGKDKDSADQLIKHAQQGHIVSAMWTWNAPSDLVDKPTITDENGKEQIALWWRGFMSYGTTFDMDKAIDDESSTQHKLLIRDIDAIAIELKKISDAKVPLLWRPIHEAEGKWFWWGNHGPKQYVKLWRLMYERITKHHQLHNLIWVYVSAGDMQWYPGDDCVDMIGADIYPSLLPSDPTVTLWEKLQANFAGRKIVTLSEFGGVPDVAKLQSQGVWWSYFNSWTAELGPKKMSDEELKRFYKSDGVKNL